jgi:hypothetical protein
MGRQPLRQARMGRAHICEGHFHQHRPTRPSSAGAFASPPAAGPPCSLKRPMDALPPTSHVQGIRCDAFVDDGTNEDSIPPPPAPPTCTAASPSSTTPSRLSRRSEPPAYSARSAASSASACQGMKERDKVACARCPDPSAVQASRRSAGAPGGAGASGWSQSGLLLTGSPRAGSASPCATPLTTCVTRPPCQPRAHIPVITLTRAPRLAQLPPTPTAAPPVAEPGLVHGHSTVLHSTARHSMVGIVSGTRGLAAVPTRAPACHPAVPPRAAGAPSSILQQQPRPLPPSHGVTCSPV